ncbi:hypothetical protein PFISCL1PPCAC_19714, partial [Pristionchus fissidentatus]
LKVMRIVSHSGVGVDRLSGLTPLDRSNSSNPSSGCSTVALRVGGVRVGTARGATVCSTVRMLFSIDPASRAPTSSSSSSDSSSSKFCAVCTLSSWYLLQASTSC